MFTSGKVLRSLGPFSFFKELAQPSAPAGLGESAGIELIAAFAQPDVVVREILPVRGDLDRDGHRDP